MMDGWRIVNNGGEARSIKSVFARDRGKVLWARAKMKGRIKRMGEAQREKLEAWERSALEKIAATNVVLVENDAIKNDVPLFMQGNTTYYDRAALVARKRLRGHKLIRERIAMFWELVNSVSEDGTSLRDGQFILKIFRAHDLDGSGSISADEMGEVIYKLGVNMSDDELEMVLETLDNDGSGQIDYDEFLTWWLSEDKMSAISLNDEDVERRHQLASMFLEYDDDRSGVVTYDEFDDLYDRLKGDDHPGTRGRSRRQVRREIDNDRSGFVSFSEFMAWDQRHLVAEAEAAEARRSADPRAGEQPSAGPGLGASAPPAARRGGLVKERTINKAQYTVCMQKISQALVWDYKQENFARVIEEDWKKDARGASEMNLGLFTDAVFEIADLWVDSVTLDDYVSFLDILYGEVADSMSHAVAQFRVDEDISAERMYEVMGLAPAEGPASDALTKRHRSDLAGQVAGALEDDAPGPGSEAPQATCDRGSEPDNVRPPTPANAHGGVAVPDPGCAAAARRVLAGEAPFDEPLTGRPGLGADGARNGLARNGLDLGASGRAGSAARAASSRSSARLARPRSLRVSTSHRREMHRARVDRFSAFKSRVTEGAKGFLQKGTPASRLRPRSVYDPGADYLPRRIAAMARTSRLPSGGDEDFGLALGRIATEGVPSFFRDEADWLLFAAASSLPGDEESGATRKFSLRSVARSASRAAPGIVGARSVRRRDGRRGGAELARSPGQRTSAGSGGPGSGGLGSGGPGSGAARGGGARTLPRAPRTAAAAMALATGRRADECRNRNDAHRAAEATGGWSGRPKPARAPAPAPVSPVRASGGEGRRRKRSKMHRRGRRRSAVAPWRGSPPAGQARSGNARAPVPRRRRRRAGEASPRVRIPAIEPTPSLWDRPATPSAPAGIEALPAWMGRSAGPGGAPPAGRTPAVPGELGGGHRLRGRGPGRGRAGRNEPVGGTRDPRPRNNAVRVPSRGGSRASTPAPLSGRRSRSPDRKTTRGDRSVEPPGNDSFTYDEKTGSLHIFRSNRRSRSPHRRGGGRRAKPAREKFFAFDFI
jgi:Ca2+-binding EF-hand superfamily protein